MLKDVREFLSSIRLLELIFPGSWVVTVIMSGVSAPSSGLEAASMDSSAKAIYFSASLNLRNPSEDFDVNSNSKFSKLASTTQFDSSAISAAANSASARAASSASLIASSSSNSLKVVYGYKVKYVV